MSGALPPGIQFSNNATALTAFPVLAGDTTVTIEAADVGPFPSAGGGTYFYATLEDRRVVPTRREIVKVTNRSNATFTVVRGQDGTAAHDFFTGAIFSHRLNAAGLVEFRKEETDARYNSVQYEAGQRIAADTVLENQLGAELNGRVVGDTNLQNQINYEANRAANAEAGLQAQIDALAATVRALRRD